ncbi:MAG: DUF4398 domain-containing protein [Gammaproteobacteria bacterium]|nr:DUF4398 domain-containing protein [Gammaproteobacteria bacterium]MDH3372883.1 DUF4398 domain-containing protein [Gammaproteobacteria bacterium]MDH3407956.1 DUF4398 domain-containing protein [Gammaproteobacteria bacterium]MDH3553575.1 DUF4398 domain-containing protein [Gammaproteobacteria bacterium]
MQSTRLIIFLRGAVLAALLAVAGCQTAPPVQEMSDARQAIMAAKEAGAAEHASDDLQAAVDFLESAERSINAENYAQARRDALQAKAKAHDALRLSETGRQDKP